MRASSSGRSRPSQAARTAGIVDRGRALVRAGHRCSVVRRVARSIRRRAQGSDRRRSRGANAPRAAFGAGATDRARHPHRHRLPGARRRLSRARRGVRSTSTMRCSARPRTADTCWSASPAHRCIFRHPMELSRHHGGDPREIGPRGRPVVRAPDAVGCRSSRAISRVGRQCGRRMSRTDVCIRPECRSARKRSTRRSASPTRDRSNPATSSSRGPRHCRSVLLREDELHHRCDVGIGRLDRGMALAGLELRDEVLLGVGLALVLGGDVLE